MWKKYAFAAVRRRPLAPELPTAERRAALMRKLELLVEAAKREGAPQAVKDGTPEDEESG